MSYLDTTHELYKQAAMETQKNLCCGPRTNQHDIFVTNLTYHFVGSKNSTSCCYCCG